MYSYSEVLMFGDLWNASTFGGVTLGLSMWCMLYHLPSWVCCVSFGCISTEPYVLLSLQEVPSMKLGGTPLSSKKN